jgi:hypothetical protein
LGAKPLYGRLLLPEDDKPGAAAAVVLSHEFWKRLFNSDPNIAGRSITLNGLGASGTGADKNHFTVAGVLRPEFMLHDEVMPTVASGRSGWRSCARAANGCREISGSAGRAIS